MTAAGTDLTQMVYEMAPFARTLGIVDIAGGPEEVRASLPWAQERCTAGGVTHGGAIMGLADTAGATCAFLNLPEESGTTTVESKTNFFRGVRDGRVDAVARPLHLGRTYLVVGTDLYDSAGRHAARVTQTQAVLA